MHRFLAACVAALLLPLDVVGQSHQFIPFVSRPQASLVDGSGAGFATGGDLDGDGRVDLVWGNGSNAVICLRTPFGYSRSFLPTTSERHVLVDLENDGDLDLACVPARPPYQTRMLLYQNQAGTMTPIALPAGLAGTMLSAVAIGDIDGDRFADLVISMPPGSAGPSIVLARGGPGLQFTLDVASTPTGLPFGLWPELMDVDGDGDLDILAAYASSFHLLRNVAGTFVDATSTLPAARIGYTVLASGDFDADGYADGAGVLPSGNLDMLWGGPGGFTYAASVANVQNFFGAWPADFDGDGDLDVLAWHYLGLEVLWNVGNRQFTRAGLVAHETTMRGVADVDADGVADVLFSLSGQPHVRCLYQARHEDAAFALGLPVFSGAFLAPWAAGDVDGDGRTDLVQVAASWVGVYRALGGGAYQHTAHAVTVNGANFSGSSQLADLDGDGDLDLAVMTNAGLTLVTNGGGGAFTSSLHIASVGQGRDNMRLGDVDDDGDLDIVVAEVRGVVLFSNRGAMTFAPAAVVVPPADPTPLTPPRCVELFDVDGDGDLDIVCDILDASGLGHIVVANEGRGFFARQPALLVNLGSVPTSVAAGDFDGDGDTDLAAIDSTPRVYRNNGGAFADRTAFDLPAVMPWCASNLVVADLDDDGDLDLAANSLVTPGMLLLLNDGTGTFVDRSQRVRPIGLITNAALRAADFDDDGDVDLAHSWTWLPLSNHVRQCISAGPPRIGGIAELRLVTGPGFGAPGLGLLGIGFALAATPLRVPGLAGQLELDPATLQIIGGVPTSAIGVSSVFVAVPAVPALMGLEVWFQGAVWPSVGRPGFTNAVYEIVVG